MRTALIASVSAASLCALASAASAQTYYYGPPQTIAPNTGTPAYSYETQVAPQPAFNGSCDIISGNRVCSGQPAGYAPAAGYAPGYGPIGAIVAAPFEVVTAPFGAFGGTPYMGGGMTNPAATGTEKSSYESHVPPQPGAVGFCDLISGNHICMP
jgi:hypothetical protein